MPKILSSLHALVFTAADDFLWWPTAQAWGIKELLTLVGPRQSDEKWKNYWKDAVLVALWICYFPAKNLWFSRAWQWATPHTENWRTVVWLWWGRGEAPTKGTRTESEMWSTGENWNKVRNVRHGSKTVKLLSSAALQSSCIQEGSLPWKHRKYQIWATREAFLVGSKLEVALFSPKAWGSTACLVSSRWLRVWGRRHYLWSEQPEMAVSRTYLEKATSDKWKWWGILLNRELCVNTCI